MGMICFEQDDAKNPLNKSKTIEQIDQDLLGFAQPSNGFLFQSEYPSNLEENTDERIPIDLFKGKDQDFKLISTDRNGEVVLQGSAFVLWGTNRSLKPFSQKSDKMLILTAASCVSKFDIENETIEPMHQVDLYYQYSNSNKDELYSCSK